MANVVELVPQAKLDRESVDRIMKQLNEAHAAGKITGIAAVTIETDKWFSHVSNMRMSDLAYCVHWLTIDLHSFMRDSRGA